MVDKSIEEIIEYLEGDGQIAIFSNLTKSRREHITELIKQHVSLLFYYNVASHQCTHLDRNACKGYGDNYETI